MNHQEILDNLEEMHDQSAKEFIGSNEADLDFKEKVAEWIETLIEKAMDKAFNQAHHSHVHPEVTPPMEYSTWRKKWIKENLKLCNDNQ